MSAGPKYEYLWMDGVKFKKPVKVSAPKYIDYLMSWVETQINDPLIFPTEEVCLHSSFLVKKSYTYWLINQKGRAISKKLPLNLQDYTEKIIAQLDCEAHLNTCFKHFIYFVKEFKLVDDGELAPLKDTIQAMLEKDAQKKIKYQAKYMSFFSIKSQLSFFCSFSSLEVLLKWEFVQRPNIKNKKICCRI
ncbi:hypothetical protein RFI_11173 [Reticulomyxa filosa]|uniref:Uncharacterized protein n=1 Tax=Reticulomyxa filosa TaxID=46433 RepID=X6NI28_RETFI|nr:hypothetical protein RFI_11173 [Reticulomyxa filosa]|eukprot:ETO25965.1 hypothetical protein RFI_11173 [Reticulomyxa filosa]